MKLITLAILTTLFAGCANFLESNTRRWWTADGTGYGFDSKDNPIKGEGSVCLGTYAGCRHMFTDEALSKELPASKIEPNSNIAPPLNSLPGQ